MKSVLGREAFLTLLADEGVTHLFGNPGTTELPIMAALSQQSSINYVLGLQESIVVAMADGYSRASGQLSACNVHVAPGLGNAMGSLFNAYWVGSPIIVTAGQQELGHGLTEPLLYGPMLAMAEPVSKWAVEVTRLEDLPRIMHRAATIATTPPTGPVFISLPGDILNEQAVLDFGAPTRVDTSMRPSIGSVNALAEQLVNAEQLVIIAGHDLVQADALDEASDLAQQLSAPVYQQTIVHSATFYSEHPCYMGGLSRNQAKVRKILEEFDTALFLGADVLRMSVHSEIEPLPPHLKILQITERPAELGKNYPTHTAIQANVRETLEALTPAVVAAIDRSNSRERLQHRLTNLQRNNWQEQQRKLVATIEKNFDGNDSLINSDRLMLEICRQLPEDAVLVDEALTASANLPGLYPYRDAKSYFGLASGGIGFAMAGVIGMQLAQPQRPHIAVIGDGSSMYSIQALWTAAHLKLPITYIIANNGGYQIIKDRLRQLAANATCIGMDFDEPPIDFVQLATSMGVKSIQLSRVSNFGDALEIAIKSNETWLLDVHLQVPR